MENEINALKTKIKELEAEMEKLRNETAQALEFMSNQFSDQLSKIMDEYKAELKMETLEFIKNYKQH